MRLELIAYRLTADCSTIELYRLLNPNMSNNVFVYSWRVTANFNFLNIISFFSKAKLF